MIPTGQDSKKKKPIEFFGQIEADTTNLVEILEGIQSEGYSEFPNQLKSQLKTYQEKIEKYKGLLQQKGAITAFYNTLKSEFGIENETSFEKGMVSLVLEYQSNLQRIAEILVKVPEAKVIIDQKTHKIEGKTFEKKDYLANASTIINLLENSYEELIKLKETTSNPSSLENIIDPTQNLNEQGQQTEDWDNDTEDKDNSDLEDKKSFGFVSKFKKTLVYGLGAVLLSAGGFGGWYLNNIYNPNRIEDRIIVSNCGDCVFDEEYLFGRLDNLLDTKNEKLMKSLGCKVKPDDAQKSENSSIANSGKKEEVGENPIDQKKLVPGVMQEQDELAKITDNQSIPGVSKIPPIDAAKTPTEITDETVTKIKFSSLYKNQFHIDDVIEPIFYIENIDHCEGQPLINSRDPSAKLKCIDGLCGIVLSKLRVGTHDLEVSCYDKEVVNNSNSISKVYQIEILKSITKPEEKVEVEVKEKGKLNFKSFTNYKARVGSKFRGEFKLEVEGLDYVPKLMTPSINFPGGTFIIKKKNEDVNDGVYTITSGVIQKKKKESFSYNLTICFEEKDRISCYTDRIAIRLPDQYKEKK
jgi:hypothetical protein